MWGQEYTENREFYHTVLSQRVFKVLQELKSKGKEVRDLQKAPVSLSRSVDNNGMKGQDLLSTETQQDP